MKELENTGELDHIQRLQMANFLLRVWGYEKTFNYFKKYAKDFNEQYTEYQLKYILKRNLKLYRCRRMMEMGFCPEKCKYFPTLNKYVWREK